MAHGYECDGCDSFVEKERDVIPPELEGGSVEVVRVGVDTGEKFNTFQWTLCEGCRRALVEFVEGEIPLGVLNVTQMVSDEELGDLQEEIRQMSKDKSKF